MSETFKKAGEEFSKAIGNVFDWASGAKPLPRREVCEKLGIEDESIPCDKPQPAGWHCTLRKGHPSEQCCLEQDPPQIATAAGK